MSPPLLAETVTLYCDSRQNPVARGALREPQPFPGFVLNSPGITLFRHGGHG